MVLRRGVTVPMVEHDRVMDLSDHVVVLNFGQMSQVRRASIYQAYAAEIEAIYRGPAGA